MDRYIGMSHQLVEKNPVDEVQIEEVKDFFNLKNIEERVASSLVGSEEDKKRFLFERWSGAADQFFGKQEQYQALLNELRSRQYSSDEEMIKVVSKEIYDFTVQNFSFEQLAQNLNRDPWFETLNDVLSYGGSSKLLHIHMQPKEGVFAGKRPQERAAYIRAQVADGLQRLARLLQGDSRWKNVEVITATSWIVAKHPELLESLKFTVENNLKGEKREKRGAFIYREDFLKEYLTGR